MTWTRDGSGYRHESGEAVIREVEVATASLYSHRSRRRTNWQVEIRGKVYARFFGRLRTAQRFAEERV